MNRFLFNLSAITVAVAVGFASAWWALNNLAYTTAVQNGQWRTHATAGSRDANIYVRATIARTGLLALPASEAVYFFTGIDAAGKPLRADCRYRLTGQDPDALWWSITLYGPDQFLVSNEPRRYSFNKSNVLRDEQGHFRIDIADHGAGGSWLPNGGHDGFSLIYRLYRPAMADPAALRTMQLPRIETVECPA